MIGKRIAAVLGAAALAGAGLAMTATPASAAYSDCTPGALCAYTGDSGYGSPGKVYGDNTNLLQYDKFNNAESVYNNGNSCNVRVYNGTSYTGSYFTLARGYTIGDLDGYRGGIFADDLASNRWC
ncbi:peptidase inhibitor family I36 protein [Streptomyces sp. ZYX-F-203]